MAIGINITVMKKVFVFYVAFVTVVTALLVGILASCGGDEEDDNQIQSVMSGESDTSSSSGSSGSESGGASSGSTGGSSSSNVPNFTSIRAKCTIGSSYNTFVITFGVSGSVIRAYAICEGKTAYAKLSGTTYTATFKLPRQLNPTYTVSIYIENINGKKSTIQTFHFHK